MFKQRTSPARIISSVEERVAYEKERSRERVAPYFDMLAERPSILGNSKRTVILKPKSPGYLREEVD